MVEQNMQNRYYDYVLVYGNTVLELGDELQEKCRKKRGGDVIIQRKKYIYFATQNGVTLLNKKNDLEITFIFNTEKDSIYFEKHHLHNFIESDLNASGLWKHFPTNKIIRAEKFDECLENLCFSGKVKKQENGYLLRKDEIY